MTFYKAKQFTTVLIIQIFFFIFSFIFRDRKAIKKRNKERRKERQQTLEVSVGITEQLSNGEIVPNGNVPHHTENPDVSANEYTDVDKHIVHATVHNEHEGLSNGSIPVANGNCLPVSTLPPPPDYDDVAIVTSNGEIRKEPLEINHVAKIGNGHVVKADHVGNGVIPDESTKPGNLTDEQKAAIFTSTNNKINEEIQSDDAINPAKSDSDSLEGTVFGGGLENKGFEQDVDMTSLENNQSSPSEIGNNTRVSLGDIHKSDGYIKELVYP